MKQYCCSCVLLCVAVPASQMGDILREAAGGEVNELTPARNAAIAAAATAAAAATCLHYIEG